MLTIIGNVGFVNAPRIVNGKDGETSVTDVGVIVNKRYKTSAGKTVEDSKLYKLAFWGPQSDVAQQYIEVGQTLSVNGEPASEIYADKQTGEAKIAHTIERFKFEFVGGAPSRRNTAKKAPVMADPSKNLATAGVAAGNPQDDSLDF